MERRFHAPMVGRDLLDGFCDVGYDQGVLGRGVISIVSESLD